MPLLNVPSFARIVPHLNPVDGKNMNRMYPGKPDGTQTERASYAITRQVVEKSDHLIDFHGGDIDENLRPYSYWQKTGRAAQDAASLGMVLAFGLDHIIITTGRPTDPADSRYLENTATTRGKPSITVEAGRAGTVEPQDVAALIDGTLSVMRHLKMLPGPRRRSRTRCGSIGWPTSPAIRRASSIRAWSAAATSPPARRSAGSPTTSADRSPRCASAAAGVVLYVRAVPTVNNGDAIASIGVVGKAPEGIESKR